MAFRLASIALALAAGLVALPTASRAVDRVVVTQSSNVVMWTLMYVARKLGYFKDEGIDLEVVVVKSGPDALAAVTAGSAQISMGFPATPIRAVEKGHKVRIFAALTNQFIGELMLRGDVAKRLNITDATTMDERLRKLKGLTISTNGAGSAADYLLQSIIRGAGMKPDTDVTITPIAGDAPTLAALELKRIDGFMTSPPTNDIARKKFGAWQLIDFTRGEYKPIDGILYVSLNAEEKWLEANPELAARVVRACARALKLLKDNPAAAKEAVRSFFPAMEAEMFDAAWAGMLPSFPATPRIQPDSIRGIVDFMGTMDGKPVKVDQDKVYTNRIVDLAERQ